MLLHGEPVYVRGRVLGHRGCCDRALALMVVVGAGFGGLETGSHLIGEDCRQGRQIAGAVMLHAYMAGDYAGIAGTDKGIEDAVRSRSHR